MLRLLPRKRSNDFLIGAAEKAERLPSAKKVNLSAPARKRAATYEFRITVRK